MSMGFSRQGYWSGLPCPSPGDLPNPGIEPRSSALRVDSLPAELPGKAPVSSYSRILISHENEGTMCVHAKSLSVVSDSGDPLNCSPPGSCVHGIFQARILEWVAISFSRGSSQSSDRTQVSYVSCIGRWFFTTSTTWEAQRNHNYIKKKMDEPLLIIRSESTLW